MRVYLAATLPRLAAAAAAGRLGPAPLGGYAVTPMLREMYLGDGEELEYLAQRLAAREALRLLAGEAEAPRRRVVLVAEVADAAVSALDGGEPGSVRLDQPVPWSAVQAGMLDDPSAEPVVTAAAEAAPLAETGDDEARWALDEAEAAELSWYAVQELDGLV